MWVGDLEGIVSMIQFISGVVNNSSNHYNRLYIDLGWHCCNSYWYFQGNINHKLTVHISTEENLIFLTKPNVHICICR